MYYQTIFYLLLFFFGASLGSFLYCLSDQWVSHSFHWDTRSSCDSCERTLRWYELLPIISFIIFRARCRSCFVELSNMYLITELVIGILFGVMSCLMLNSFSFLTYCHYVIVFSLLVCMSFCDLHARWVPDVLQLCLLAVVLTHRINVMTSTWLYITWLGFIILFVLFYIIASDWIGGADIKLLAILSGAVDPLVLPYLLLIASLSGLIYLAFVSYVLKRQVKAIPFIPFISFSFYIVGIIMAIP